MQEIEIKFLDIDPEKIEEKLSIPQIRHQQKRRIHYELDAVSIDLDFWPLIPPMIEIEGKSLDEIKAVANKLKLKQETAIDALQIHQEIYGIDLTNMPEMIFTETQLQAFKQS